MKSVITVNHLKKYFHDVKAVDDISFSVEKGELFGFLGVNGAGKSTTINMLCTLMKPTAGSAEICGLALGANDAEIKRRIGIVFQNNVLDKILTVKENLLLRGGLYEKDRTKLKKSLERICGILSLEDVLNRPFGKLSGGQKRRCEIARALMHTPEILFLDEPTTGLDPATRKAVWETVHSLRQELKMTVFLTTHYMEEAAGSDHIAIMSRGKLTQFGTPFSLKERFAKDRLSLIPKLGETEAIRAGLREIGLAFREREGVLEAAVENTMAALPVVEKFSERLDGFEVVQGTMDDVFLNAAKGDTVCEAF